MSGIRQTDTPDTDTIRHAMLGFLPGDRYPVAPSSTVSEVHEAHAALDRLSARAARVDDLEAALRLNQAVAEAADRYTDVVAQSADVSFEDDAWMELCSALRDWSSARAAGGVAVEEPQP